MSDRTLLHLLRDAKKNRGSTLPETVVKNLPAHISEAEAVFWDTEDPALIYMFALPNDELRGKAVVRIGFVLKGTKTNALRTGGRIDRLELERKARYKKIR